MRYALSELTTLRLGGPARELVQASSEDELVDAVRAADAAGDPVLVLAGGSNVVIADEGFDGTVVLVRSTGVRREGDALEVAAGEPWDALVARSIEEGLAGIECLSGIPGSTGATPIQNVGAYGQDVSETVQGVRVLDRERGEVRELHPDELRFAYRSSALKGASRHVVLAVHFGLDRSAHSAPVRYAELARALGVAEGATAPLADVREAVLALRRAKGMVIDAADPDSVSAGSFFTNPIVPEADAPHGAPWWLERDGCVKVPAAWLIERAGFAKGLQRGPVGISTKHTLALVNRGGATAAQLLELAHEIATGVRDAFDIELRPEPVLVGTSW